MGRRPDSITALVHDSDRSSGLYDMVEDARAGDRAAFARLFDECADRVFRVAMSQLRSEADAHDVVSETFLVVWQKLADWRWTGAPFGAWLLGIAYRVSQAHGRQRGRHSHADLDAGDTPVADGDGSHFSDHVDRRLDVMAALGQLTADQREVVTLRFFGGLSAEEVAVATNRSAVAVRQLQFRAIARMEQLAADHRPDASPVRKDDT